MDDDASTLAQSVRPVSRAVPLGEESVKEKKSPCKQAVGGRGQGWEAELTVFWESYIGDRYIPYRTRPTVPYPSSDQSYDFGVAALGGCTGSGG